MSRKYKFRNQTANYFISFTVVNWIDVFTRRVYKDILVDSMNYCAKVKGLLIYAWVIMSNYVHMIVGTDDLRLQDIIRDLKKYTSKAVLKSIKDNSCESRKEWMLNIFRRAGIENSNNARATARLYRVVLQMQFNSKSGLFSSNDYL